MLLISLIDNPKELLELITDCLKPKYLKKNFYELINDKDNKILIETKKKVVKSKKNNNYLFFIKSFKNKI